MKQKRENEYRGGGSNICSKPVSGPFTLTQTLMLQSHTWIPSSLLETTALIPKTGALQFSFEDPRWNWAVGYLGVSVSKVTSTPVISVHSFTPITNLCKLLLPHGITRWCFKRCRYNRKRMKAVNCACVSFLTPFSFHESHTYP